MNDQSFYNVLCVVATLLVVGLALVALASTLRRARPDLAIARPMAVAFGVRVAAIGIISLTSVATTLRGGDELLFQANARKIAASGFGSKEWADALTSTLHEWVFAIQFRLLDSPELALRITQVGLGVAGLICLSTAVYDLAGSHSARLAAWLLALEPAGIFFSGLLHKEALLFFASGLIALGCAAVWTKGHLHGVLLVAGGCLVASVTRPYAGFFLIGAAVLVMAHAAARRARRDSPATALALFVVVVAAVAIGAPKAVDATSDKDLAGLQVSQDANTSDTSNLKLEQVDFSSRGAVVLNIPRRLRDVALRPYPWQVENLSQQLGVLGTFAAIAAFVFLLRALWRARGQVMDRAGPLFYITALLFTAYALSAGNAGTSFRYRSHIVALAICAIVTLWRTVEARESAGAGDERAPSRRPVLAAIRTGETI